MKVRVYVHDVQKSNRIYDLENETDKRIVLALFELFGEENVEMREEI